MSPNEPRMIISGYSPQLRIISGYSPQLRIILGYTPQLRIISGYTPQLRMISANQLIVIGIITLSTEFHHCSTLLHYPHIPAITTLFMFVFAPLLLIFEYKSKYSNTFYFSLLRILMIFDLHLYYIKHQSNG